MVTKDEFLKIIVRLSERWKENGCPNQSQWLWAKTFSFVFHSYNVENYKSILAVYSKIWHCQFLCTRVGFIINLESHLSSLFTKGVIVMKLIKYRPISKLFETISRDASYADLLENNLLSPTQNWLQKSRSLNRFFKPRMSAAHSRSICCHSLFWFFQGIR